MKHVEIRAGLYRDSVRLMQISSALATYAGIEQVLVAMATDLNLDLLAGMGFAVPAHTGPNDLLVALDASDDATMAGILQRLDVELSADSGSYERGSDSVVRPRTTGAAARRITSPAVALISTPGQYAFVEAMDALDAGLSVLIFSDNVPIDQEVRLKAVAAQRGLLVMGPDCGTALLGGVGLGFANVMRPGPVGLVAASGTGAQQVMSLLAAAGVGVSHCLGVGGRDLSAQVAGASTHAALDALDADPHTELIVLVGKSPCVDVANAVTEHALRLTTPVVIALLGPGQPDLTTVAASALARLGAPVPDWPCWSPTAPPPTNANSAGGSVRGLFSGGTLCQEAVLVATPTLGPIWSNVGPPPRAAAATAHRMIDLGDDEFTIGRPHPMIDFGPRLARLAAEAADPRCRVMLLDVVLGHGAHPDPASELAPAVRAALAGRAGILTVVVGLIGTVDDPQDLHAQAQSLRAAGAWVYLSNAAAACHAARVALGATG